MKKLSSKGIELIKSFEGCSLTAYKCVDTEKYYTIGWGHYGADVRKNQTISQVEADLMLLVDLEKEAAYVNDKRYVPLTDQLNQNQFDALVSFCYNCGPGNLKTLCKNRSLNEISTNILKYNKSGGKVLEGLTRRRKAEKELFDTKVVELTKNESNQEGFKMDTLRKGSTANDVTVFEILMKKLGYYDGAIDTTFGNKCVAACNDFQKKYTECGTNGNPDSTFGPKCWAKLFSLNR